MDARIEGRLALGDSLSGNIQIGFNHLNLFTPSGLENLFIGNQSGRVHTSGERNTYIGNDSGRGSTSATNNTFVGVLSGQAIDGGDRNTFIGYSAGYNNSNSNNVFLGNEAGFRNTLGRGNVFIGYAAAFNESGSNRLYIENTNSATPLIYGEFDSDKAGINWDSTIPLPATLSVNGTIHISETAKLEPLSSPPSTCMTPTEYGLMYYDNSVSPHTLKLCTDTGWNDLN